jgi:hypothetical protein
MPVKTRKLNPTIDSSIKAIPSHSRVDEKGRAICVWCDKRLRWNMGWGYEGLGIFCSMKCAASWGNLKASAGSDNYER